MRAVADVAADERESRAIVEQALEEGLRRGLITRSEAAELGRRQGNAEWFERLLKTRSR